MALGADHARDHQARRQQPAELDLRVLVGQLRRAELDFGQHLVEQAALDEGEAARLQLANQLLLHQRFHADAAKLTGQRLVLEGQHAQRHHGRCPVVRGACSGRARRRGTEARGEVFHGVIDVLLTGAVLLVGHRLLRLAQQRQRHGVGRIERLGALEHGLGLGRLAGVVQRHGQVAHGFDRLRVLARRALVGLDGRLRVLFALGVAHGDQGAGLLPREVCRGLAAGGLLNGRLPSLHLPAAGERAAADQVGGAACRRLGDDVVGFAQRGGRVAAQQQHLGQAFAAHPHDLRVGGGGQGAEDALGIVDLAHAQQLVAALGARDVLDAGGRRQHRGAGLGRDGGLEEDELALERGALPWNLAAVGVEAHTQAHALEDLFDRHAGALDVGQQVLRVQPVGALAVAGHAARRRGKGHQRADGCIKLRQPAAARARGARKGVVSAGIQDDDVDAVLGRLHLVEHLLHVDRLVRHFVLALDVGAHRHQEVAALDLHAVAGKVEQARAAGLEAITERGDGVLQLLLRRVQPQIDLEAGLLEHLGHGRGVVGRVDERRAGVIGIADH